MQHARRVNGLERPSQRPGDSEPVVRWQRSVTGDMLGQRGAVKELGDDVVAVAAEVAAVQEPSDAGMVQLFERGQVTEEEVKLAVKTIRAQGVNDDATAAGTLAAQETDAKDAGIEDSLWLVTLEGEGFEGGRVETGGTAQGGHCLGVVAAVEGGAVGVVVSLGLAVRVADQTGNFLKVVLTGLQIADYDFQLREAVKQCRQAALLITRQLAEALDQILHGLAFAVAPQSQAIARPHRARVQVVPPLEVAHGLVKLLVGLSVFVLFRQ